MACGLPIITTYNSGSIIQDKQEGFIIPIQSIKAIKEKILFFYNHKNNIVSFGKRGRKLVNKYTWDNYAKKVCKMYGGISK